MALLTQYVACDMYHQHEEKRKGWKRRKMGKEGDEDVVDAQQENSMQGLQVKAKTCQKWMVTEVSNKWP